MESDLAVNGGPRVRERPWPDRRRFGPDDKSAVDALFDESIATGRPFRYDGPSEEAFCREFAEFMGGGFVDGVSSGSTALYVALKALGVEPFTEVIVGCMTDPGGMMPIPLLNCIPIVADVTPGTLSPGPDQIEALVTPHTSAIVVAHIAGYPADVRAIAEVAPVGTAYPSSRTAPSLMGPSCTASTWALSAMWRLSPRCGTST